MPGACSAELRERVLVAVAAGESPDAVAEQFTVVRASVDCWVAACTQANGWRVKADHPQQD
jgi:transposase